MKILDSPFSARRKRFSPWRYGLKLGLAAALFVWWWLQNQREEDVEVTETRVVLPPDDAMPAPAPAAKPKAPTAEPDDLTRIDGIGPKYASVLADAGVTTFAKLAKMKPDIVQEIFRTATGRAPDPSDWIDQASKLSG